MPVLQAVLCLASFLPAQVTRPASATEVPDPRVLLFDDPHELLPRSPLPLTSVAAGDVDADGDVDLFFCGGEAFSGSVGKPRVCLNDGDGRFHARVVAGPAEVSARAELVDLDSDSDLDCLAGSRTYFNDGAGNFALDPVPHGLSQDRVVVDLSGDGFADVAATNRQLRLNDGTGHFVAAPANLPAGPAASRISAGDVDGDLDLDLLLTGGSSPCLYRNDGGALFTDVSAQLPPVANSGLQLVDVDGDLDFDALGGTALFLNGGAGTFTNASGQLPGSISSAGTILDVDSDGDVDIVFANLLWKNDGTGVFTSFPVQLPGGVRVSADADSDGDADLCSIHAGLTDDFSSTFSRIELVLNDGSGTFALASQWTQELATQTYTDANEVATCGALFDLDGDGDLDVATGRAEVSLFDDGHWVLAWHANDGDGRFVDQAQAFPNWFTLPTCMRAGDLDGDGDGDLVIGGFDNLDGSGGGVSALLGSSGSFVLRHAAGGDTADLELGDADGDGDLDVVFCGLAPTGQAPEGLQLLQAGGTFSSDPTFPALALDATDVTWADVDRDGDLDVLFAGSSPRLLLNQPVGWSDASFQLGFGAAESIAAGDVDGDLYPDLLVVDGSAARLYTNSAGSFPAGETLAALVPAPTRARLVDLDADGDLDGLVFRQTFPETTARAYENRSHHLRPGAWALPQFSLDQAAFGDVDFDRDLDVLSKGRLFSNLTRHLCWQAPAKLGRTQRLALRGPARSPWVLRSSLVPLSGPGPGGVLLGAPISTVASGALDWFGHGSTGLAIPNDPLLIGVEVYLQAGVGTPMRFTNRETSLVSGF